MTDPTTPQMPAIADGTVRPCKKCGREILFLTAGEGKTAVLDIKPRLGAVLDDRGRRLVRWQWIYETHFATCPNADEFRKKPAAKGGSAAPSKSAPSPSAFKNRKET